MSSAVIQSVPAIVCAMRRATQRTPRNIWPFAKDMVEVVMQMAAPTITKVVLRLMGNTMEAATHAVMALGNPRRKMVIVGSFVSVVLCCLASAYHSRFVLSRLAWNLYVLVRLCTMLRFGVVGCFGGGGLGGAASELFAEVRL